jgi:hypothetical protein
LAYGSAPSIFSTGLFGRYVVTHFLADADLHGHRPAVLTHRLLFWVLSTVLWLLITSRGSSPLAPDAYHRSPTTILIPRPFAVRCPLASSWSPHGPRLLYYPSLPLVLSCGTFRREPATRVFDWSFAPIPWSPDRFARQNPSKPLPGFPPASLCLGIVHTLSGPNRCTLTQIFQ